jgi:serine/threonine-protein kinase
MARPDPRCVEVRLRYEADQLAGYQPDLRTLASAHADLESDLFRQLLILDFWRRWESGQGEPVAVYLKPYRDRQDATQHPETRLRLVIVQILQMGSEPEEGEYLNQFGDLQGYLPGVFELYYAHGRSHLRQMFSEAVREFWGEGPEPPTAVITRVIETPSVGYSLPETRHFQLEDEYQLQEEIGRGQFKLVYRALQRSTGRAVAVKFCLPLSNHIDEHKDRFFREGRTQALMDHPHIPVILTLADSIPPVIVEKLLPQQDWSRVLANRSVDQNLRTLLRVSRALAYAHRTHRVIHRDVKPQNVIIGDQDEEVYLVDWGFALHVEGDSPCDGHPALHRSEEDSFCGTPQYMAPEMALFQFDRFSFGTDVYLLGGILFEILTGNPPNPGGRFSAAIRAMRSHSSFQTDLLQGRGHPPELIRIAVRALAVEISDRHPDAGDFADSIQVYLDHTLLQARCGQVEEGLDRVKDEMTMIQNSGIPLHIMIPKLLDLAEQFRQIRIAWHGVGDDEATSPDGGYVRALDGEAAARFALISLSRLSHDFGLARAQLRLIADIDQYAATVKELEIMLDQESPLL